MKDKVQAAKAMAERASVRHTAAEERASRLEAELAAALESAAAEARLAQRQVPAEARSTWTVWCTFGLRLRKFAWIIWIMALTS